MAKVGKKASKSSVARSAKRSSASKGPERFQRTREDHSTETAEDYVELVEELTYEQGEARLVDIADRMGVSHVTANKTLGRLLRDGLISKQPYRSIFLTEKGVKLAHRCRLRHELVVKFLCTLGVPRKQAEIDAEGIEHHISNATLKAMSSFVDGSPAKKR